MTILPADPTADPVKIDVTGLKRPYMEHGFGYRQLFRGQKSLFQLKHLFFISLIVYFTSYFVFSIAVLQHRTGVVYYHLLLRQENRIAPFSF